ncbi:hypothetical protein Tco_0439227, partial [Tanacetum coccineum]
VFVQKINTAYSLLLNMAYRSSDTVIVAFHIRLRISVFSLFQAYPTDCLSLVSEYSEEEEAETMAETMEQYMSKTRTDYGSGVARPKIDNKDQFELKGQFLKELRENTFSGSDHEDANEHIEKVLKIVDLFHVPNITVDQLMLRVFPISLTGAASRWLRNEPTGSIKTWEDLKTKFLNKYCPPGRTAKKMEEINNFQQEPDETLYQAWERFKELLMKCPQHYLTEMQEVILFYNGLDIPTRQILDSRGAIPSKTAADAKTAIQEMAAYSQKWHNGTSRTRSTETSYGLAAIQAQLNNLGREIKKVNEKVYAAQVGCGGYRATTLGFYQRNNANPSYQERRKSMEDTLSKFMSESARRHEENSNLIKEIRALIDAAIRNQGASIKTLELQIGCVAGDENVIAAHQEDIMVLPQPQGKSSKPGSTGQISFAMHVDWSELAMHVNEPTTSPQGMKHLKNWSHKLEDALWAFRTEFKTPLGTTPFRIIYGKACHLSVKLEHKAYWAIKNCNMDLTKAEANWFLQINELDEMRLDAYESSISYKERTKRLFPGKLKSRWYRPFSVSKDMKNGAIERYNEDENGFIVNKQRVKPYQKDVLDADKDDDITLEDEGEVTKFFKKNEEEIFTVGGGGVRIYPDGVAPPDM